jgi:hypothetical protein
VFPATSQRYEGRIELVESTVAGGISRMYVLPTKAEFDDVAIPRGPYPQE